VKPIHLNLASRPYRDYRPVYAVVVLTSLLTAFLMLNNVDTYYRYIHETRTTRTKIAQIEAETEKERRLAADVDRRTKGIDLELLDVQSHFVNAKLAERAFSWSVLLDKLETILADNVRLVSIQPQFDETGAIALTMQFESKSTDGMIETLDRMNADPAFHNAFPSSEAQANGIFTFGISSTYQPETAAAPAVQKAVAR
jgi:hypothetical protein